MTARRDLSALARDGLAVRTYGGAVLPERRDGDLPLDVLLADEDPFEHRLREAPEAKIRLARATLERVEEGDTLLVDSSTSGYFAVRELLAARRAIRVVTNSLAVMNVMADAPAGELIALGGSLHAKARCFVGHDTVRAIRSLMADKALISPRGLSAIDGRISDGDLFQAEIRRAMIDCSTQTVLFAAGYSLQRPGLTTTGNLSDIAVVLAADISEEQAAALAAFGPEVTCV
jgi:DeoR/GlpR family transcriptional regulator of sugar metabolism